jgi:hypothetical protein
MNFQAQSLTKASIGQNRGVFQRRCDTCRKKKPMLQRAAVHPGPNSVPPIVHDVLRSPGQPLDAATRAFMEPRFGQDFSRIRTHNAIARSAIDNLIIGPPDDHFEQEAAKIGNQTMQTPARRAKQSFSKNDFSRVRVHIDGHAAESAQAVNALAYTVGHNIVFGAGQYAPRTLKGSSLLAHELTHVTQQNSGQLQGEVLQRSIGGFLTNILREVPVIGFFFHPSQKELEGYLKKLDETGKIEDDWDSDNKAFEIVQSWKKGEGKFVLTARRKALLILEMLSGWVGGDDQGAILDLLERSDNPELEYIFGEGKVKHEDLLSEFGSSKEQLYRFYQRRFQSAYPEQTYEQLIGSGAPPTKPDPKKLSVAKPGGTMVQLGDKLPETASPLYSGIKSKETKKRTDPLTITEADEWMNEVYGQYLPEDKKTKSDRKKGYAEANFSLKTEPGGTSDTFQSFLEYCISLANSKMRGNKEEMDKWKDRCSYEESITAGFFDREGKEMVVRPDRESPTTRLHEVVHAYADESIDEKLTRYAREGLTEYLTRQIVSKHKMAKGEKRPAKSQSYGGPYDAILELSLIVGEPALAKAHFQGDVKSICLALGKSVFDKWLEQMDSMDGWQEAIKLVRNRKVMQKGKGQDAEVDQCS